MYMWLSSITREPLGVIDEIRKLSHEFDIWSYIGVTIGGDMSKGCVSTTNRHPSRSARASMQKETFWFVWPQYNEHWDGIKNTNNFHHKMKCRRSQNRIKMSNGNDEQHTSSTDGIVIGYFDGLFKFSKLAKKKISSWYMRKQFELLPLWVFQELSKSIWALRRQVEL